MLTTAAPLLMLGAVVLVGLGIVIERDNGPRRGVGYYMAGVVAAIAGLAVWVIG